ncbi:UNVERIFIED_CONTAM: hypothetical protein K2H54_053264 [Gekko kuhli]
MKPALPEYDPYLQKGAGMQKGTLGFTQLCEGLFALTQQKPSGDPLPRKQPGRAWTCKRAITLWMHLEKRGDMIPGKCWLSRYRSPTMPHHTAGAGEASLTLGDVGEWPGLILGANTGEALGEANEGWESGKGGWCIGQPGNKRKLFREAGEEEKTSGESRRPGFLLRESRETGTWLGLFYCCEPP